VRAGHFASEKLLKGKAQASIIDPHHGRRLDGSQTEGKLPITHNVGDVRRQATIMPDVR
jgi:hypothetical protein